MATKTPVIHHSQQAANYINKKGINELFEAMMTALMIQKPDDHIAFMRECLDKAQKNPTRIRWELFVSNASANKSFVPPARPLLNRSRTKTLPPVQTNHANTKSTPPAASKPSALPPIEDHKKNGPNVPIIFILSTNGSAKLCSRLLERYHQITYISINDAANIDEDNYIDWEQMEHRYAAVHRIIEQRSGNTRGFLVAGDLHEKNFGKQWQDKLGHIDQVIVLSPDPQPTLNRNSQVLQIDINNDFDDILAVTIRTLDAIFPQDAFSTEHSGTMETKSKEFTLPVFFCVDNHRLVPKDNNSNASHTAEHLSLDDEFDLVDDGLEEESNNSFIKTLCERLSEQHSLKHIHYGDLNTSLLTFDQLKACIIESMSTVSGFIIDHFPTSLSDLERFRREIGPCAALIYIGEHRTGTKNSELNIIVEQFKKNNKSIFVDCRMEVDEIYEDLKSDLLKYM